MVLYYGFYFVVRFFSSSEQWSYSMWLQIKFADRQCHCKKIDGCCFVCGKQRSEISSNHNAKNLMQSLDE